MCKGASVSLPQTRQSAPRSPHPSAKPPKKMRTTALTDVHAGWQSHTHPTPPNPAAVTNRSHDLAARGDLDDEDESQEQPQGPAPSSRKASLCDLAAHS